MDKLVKPQIICHIEKSLDYSLLDTKWIPCSAKFVVLGTMSRGTGVVQIYEIDQGEIKVIKEFGKPAPIKCATFKASCLRDRHMAVGDIKVCIILFKLYVLMKIL